MGKIGWVDRDLKTVWVVCDKCLETTRRLDRRNKDHWVNAGNLFEIQEAIKKTHKYHAKCPKGHEVEISSFRFWREGSLWWPHK